MKNHSSAARLATLATITAYAAFGGRQYATAQTQQNQQSNSKNPGSATLPVRRFTIAAGPLNTALHDFEIATGLKVEVTLPQGAADLLDGFKSNGVNGLYPNDVALKQLLVGTGLAYQFTAADHVQISLRRTDTVDVSAPLPNAVSMQKFTEPLLDTPQSIAVIPQFIIHDQGVSTLRDTLRNVPGISLAAGEAGAQGDNLTIRGFTARNDIFLDGIRDFGSYFRDSFNYEQVDVLEGPAGIQFGRGSTGGVINQESKVPQNQTFITAQTQFGTDKTRRLTADINQPLPNVAAGTAVRINVMALEAGVAGRNQAQIRRFGIAPSISVGLNSKTRASLSYLHLNGNDTPDYGLPWLYNKLAPGVNRHSYFGFGTSSGADQNFIKTNDDILTLKGDHSFGDHTNLHTIARAANYPRNAQITEPQICSNAAVSVPVGGYVTALPTSSVTGAVCPVNINSNPALILVNRNQLQIKSVEGNLWDQTELATRFKFFGMRHALVAGAEGGQEFSNPIRTNYNISGINTVPSATLINPNEQQPFSGTGYILSVAHAKSKSVGLYFVDTVHLGRLFELSGGIRWDRFDSGYSLYQPTPPPTGGTKTTTIGPISRIDKQPTYRAAFVYKPSTHGSVYFDYGTSFNPSAESLALSVSTSVLPPEQNETYEVGSKWSFLNERLMLEGALFRTEKDNAREASPTDSTVQQLVGNQVVRGLQVSVVGRLPEGMNIIAGYAYLDSQVLKSLVAPLSVGYRLANVPKQTFNFFVTHRLPLRLNGGIGGNYVASRTASSSVPFVPLTFSAAQTFAAGSAPCGTAATTTCYQVLSTGIKQIPGYWVFNAMLKRPITDRLDFQVNVNNVLNRFYIDQPHPSHLIPGAGASALIGINFKF